MEVSCEALLPCLPTGARGHIIRPRLCKRGVWVLSRAHLSPDNDSYPFTVDTLDTLLKTRAPRANAAGFLSFGILLRDSCSFEEDSELLTLGCAEIEASLPPLKYAGSSRDEARAAEYNKYLADLPRRVAEFNDVIELTGVSKVVLSPQAHLRLATLRSVRVVEPTDNTKRGDRRKRRLFFPSAETLSSSGDLTALARSSCTHNRALDAQCAPLSHVAVAIGLLTAPIPGFENRGIALAPEEQLELIQNLNQPVLRHFDFPRRFFTSGFGATAEIALDIVLEAIYEQHYYSDVSKDLRDALKAYTGLMGMEESEAAASREKLLEMRAIAVVVIPWAIPMASAIKVLEWARTFVVDVLNIHMGSEGATPNRLRLIKIGHAVNSPGAKKARTITDTSVSTKTDRRVANYRWDLIRIGLTNALSILQKAMEAFQKTEEAEGLTPIPDPVRGSLAIKLNELSIALATITVCGCWRRIGGNVLLLDFPESCMNHDFRPLFWSPVTLRPVSPDLLPVWPRDFATLAQSWDFASPISIGSLLNHLKGSSMPRTFREDDEVDSLINSFIQGESTSQLTLGLGSIQTLFEDAIREAMSKKDYFRVRGLMTSIAAANVTLPFPGGSSCFLVRMVSKPNGTTQAASAATVGFRWLGSPQLYDQEQCQAAPWNVHGLSIPPRRLVGRNGPTKHGEILILPKIEAFTSTADVE